MVDCISFLCVYHNVIRKQFLELYYEWSLSGKLLLEPKLAPIWRTYIYTWTIGWWSFEVIPVSHSENPFCYFDFFRNFDWHHSGIDPPCHFFVQATFSKNHVGTIVNVVPKILVKAQFYPSSIEWSNLIPQLLVVGSYLSLV